MTSQTSLVTLTSAEEDIITDWTNYVSYDLIRMAKEYQARCPERDLTRFIAFLELREGVAEYSMTAYLQDTLPRFFCGSASERLIIESQTERFPTDEDLMEHLTEFVNNTTNVHLIDWFTELQVLGNWNYETQIRRLEELAESGDLFEKVYDTIKEHMDDKSPEEKMEQHVDNKTPFYCPQLGGTVEFNDAVCAGEAWYCLKVLTGLYARKLLWIEADSKTYYSCVNSDGFGFNWGDIIPNGVDSMMGGDYCRDLEGVTLEFWGKVEL